MKRFFILLLTMFLFPAFCFAQDYKIKNSEQYKREIEAKIAEESPKIKANIDGYFEKAKKAYSMYLQAEMNNKDTSEYNFLIGDYRRGIEYADVLFLSSLIDITDKHRGMKHEPLCTDFGGALFDYLEPYFKANNVDYSEIYQIFIYQNKNLKKLEEHLE